MSNSLQLCIRYTLQLGTVSLPKTTNPVHMRSNADVDFVITDEDMAALPDLEEHDYDLEPRQAPSYYPGSITISPLP